MTSIAYLINLYPSPSHTFIRREIRSLEARGWRVERYSLRRPGRLVDPADVEEEQRTRVVLAAGAPALLGALVRDAVTRPRRFLRAFGLAYRLSRRSDRGLVAHLAYLAEACLLRGWLARSGARHIHAHFGTNSTAVAMLCRELGGPPYSFTVHGPDEFDRPRALSLSEKSERAAFAVAISQFGLSQLRRWTAYEDWHKLHVVRCGVDAVFLKAERVPVPATRRLVGIGRLSEQKGWPVLIEAAALLHSRGEKFEVVVIGDGPLREPLQALIDRSGLSDRVRLVGVRSGPEIRDELLGARALVLPSFAEGLPVVLMESLALGRPVVTTQIAGIPELVRDGREGWLVPPASTEALAQALSAVLGADPQDLEGMGRSGAARVAANHDADIEAARLSGLIAHVLQVDEPGPPGEQADRVRRTSSLA